MRNLHNRVKKVKKELNAETVAKHLHSHIQDITPVNSGYAKRNTRLERNTVNLDYDYAGVLEKGRRYTNKGMRGSKYLPQGFTTPAYKYLKDLIQRNLR
jgi:flagellar basal body rod protein FlgB